MTNDYWDKKWVAIVNPASGNGGAKKKWKKKAEPILQKMNLDYTEYYTQAPNDAIDFIKSNIDNYDGFLAVGGDGISNEVINGILLATHNKQIPNNKIYSIIPAGTGNDIANAFDLPYKSIEDSCNLLKPDTSYIRKVDAGKATGENFDNEPVTRYFCGVFSCGFDADVAYKTQHGSKWLPGTASYIKALLANLIRLNSRDYTVTIEGGGNPESFTKNGILIAVGLGQYYGAGMKITPHAKVDDGLLNITFINKIPRRTLLRVFPKVYDGKHITHKSVYLNECTRISIETDRESLWQVDGEAIGNAPVKLENISGALNVLSPVKTQDSSD